MNKHLYRIIFNAARGMRMVVQETAASIGKGASKGTLKAAGSTAAAVALFGVLVAGTVRAQIVGAPNVPGNLRPTVLVAPNGVPLINIQTPSAAGVSRNVYNQFDVMRNGAVLNNSRVNVQTQLGGIVQGNPWLAGGPARVILNEINGGNPTQLRGYVEVGGPRAEVIIANPAGISVNGGGFINASRATLTTGVPQLNASGGLDSFLVRNGTVGIEGAGLDASRTDYAAILARAVQVNAGIWASELKVVTGANNVSADHGSVTPVAGTGPSPAFALDVAALGGMYAQKITLIGTEAGLGVRNAGNVGAGAGGLVVTAQGRLENTGTFEGPRVELDSSAGIDNRGGTIRQTSMAGLTIDSPVLSNTNGGVIGEEPLTPTTGAGGTASTGGTAAASNPSNPSADAASVGASQVPSYVPPSPGTITAADTIQNDGGRIYAGGPITLKTPQINNAGGTLNVATMAVSGSSFSNAGGTLNVSQSFGANVGRFDNTGGKLNAGSLHIATGGDLINVDGTLTSGSDVSLTVGGNADNTHGTVSAAGRLTAHVAKTVNNGAGTLVANQDLTIDATALDSSKGSVQSVNAGVQLDVADRLANTGGAIGAAADLSMKAGSIGTSGTIRVGNDATLAVAGALVNDGRITAGRNTAISAGSLASGSASVLGAGVLNDSKLGAAGDLSVTASGMLTANGMNLAAGNAALQGASIDLSKSQTSAANIAITATQGDVSTSDKAKVLTPGTLSIVANARAGQTLVNDAGALNAGRLHLQASSIANTHGGEILQTGADATTVAVSGTLNNDGGRIAGNSHDLSLSAATLSSVGGKIEHAGAGTLRMTGGSYNGAGGQITGNGALVVDLSDGFAQDNGRTVAKQITIDAGSLSNRGGKVFGTSLSVDTRGGELDNSAKGTMAAMEAVVLRSGALNNDAGLIQSGGSLHIDTNSQVLTNTNAAGYRTQPADLAGGIVSGGTLDLKTGDVKNVAGSVGSKGALTADTQAFTNTDGVLMGGQPAALGADGKMRSGTGGVFLNAKSFSGDGQIISANDLGIALVQDVTNNASIGVNGNLSYLTAGKFTNNTKLLAGRTLTVGGSSVDNTAGAEMSGADTIVNAATTLTNRGLIDSQGSTQIDSGALNNVGAGRIYGSAVSVASGTLDNYAETVGGVTRAGTIAARETLNIGANTVSNREHALIFSGGVGTKAMSIGGKLDGNREATTSGGVLSNLSARIESLGGMTISMGQIDNLDTHIRLGPQTTTRQFSRTIGVEGIGHFKPEDVAYTPGKPNLAIRNPDGGWRPANGHVWGLWDKTVVTTTDTAIDADPADIVAGRDMALNGGGLNRDSRITAGGVLTAPGIRNEALQGEVTTQTGSIVHWRATKREPDIIEPVSRVSKDVGTYEKTGGLNATRGYDAGKPASGANGGNGNVTIVEVPANVGAVVKTDGRSNPGVGASQVIPMVVRTSAPRVDIPRASLFNLNGGPQGYLVETDPRFANYRNWLSSDYLLSGLGLDPNNTLKRLGDGFYEQKLIREQVAQLTGYRYLGGYYSDEEQYTALMNNGATFAGQYGLRPGIGLSEAQMAQLTSDIVWLVEQTVTLPDGSTRNVLAPQLYARLRPGDIDGSGALLSADATVIKGDGNLMNTGTIAGRTLVRIDKDNVNNLGGRIAGGDLAIHARTDLNNIGGSITAGDVAALTAGRDINIRSTTQTDGSNKNADRIAGLYVTNPGGTLVASAGRDVNLIGGIISNQGTGGYTSITAKNDINLGTVTETRVMLGSSVSTSMVMANSQELGSTISTNGTTVLKAGRDVNARQAIVDAGKSLLAVHADRDINIEAGETRATGSYSAQWTDKKTFSRTNNNLFRSFDAMTSVGSKFSGGLVSLGAKNDINVIGSSLSGKDGVAVIAQGNLTIVEGRNTSNAGYQLSQQKRGISALGAAMGFVMPSGRATATGSEISSDTAAPSTISSSNGGILLQGNSSVFLQGVQVDAAKDVAIKGGNVVIQAAMNRQSVIGTTGSQNAWYDFGSAAILKDVGKGIKARETTATEVDVTTLTRTNISGANVSIAADDTLALRGTAINTPGKLSLAADMWLMGTQTTEEAMRTTSQGRDLVYQVSRDKGTTDQTTNYNLINAGKLSVTASRVQVGLGARDSIEQLSKQPGMGWVDQLTNDPKLSDKVDWQRVDEVHKNWNYDKQGLTPEGAAVVTLVVAYFTAGAASGVGGSVASGVGATGTTAVVVSGAVTAGLTALASQAGVAVINNQGDIGKALHDLGSSANVKSLLTAIITGGVLGGLDLNPTGLPTAGAGSQEFFTQLGQNLKAGAARAVIGTAINGGSLEDSLKDGLKNAILDTVAAQGAVAIGKQFPVGDFSNYVAHAIAGCAVGAARASNGCGSGALGAVVGEASAIAHNDGRNVLTEGLRSDTAAFASMFGGLAAAIAGGNASEINIGSQAAGNAAANNFTQAVARGAAACATVALCRNSVLLAGAAVAIDAKVQSTHAEHPEWNDRTVNASAVAEVMSRGMVEGVKSTYDWFIGTQRPATSNTGNISPLPDYGPSHTGNTTTPPRIDATTGGGRIAQANQNADIASGGYGEGGIPNYGGSLTTPDNGPAGPNIVMSQSNSGQPVFGNQLPERLRAEIAAANTAGVKPISPSDPSFESVVNQGKIKFVVTVDGNIFLAPHTINEFEISHAVLSGGKPVVSAGEADISGFKGFYFGTIMNPHSGHFLNGATKKQTETSDQMARAAFERIGIKFPPNRD